jgi:hypothetical protein
MKATTLVAATISMAAGELPVFADYENKRIGDCLVSAIDDRSETAAATSR